MFVHSLLPLLLFFVTLSGASSQNLIFPTDNHNLYEHPEHFYMKTVRSGPDPWRGGMYGFSRDAKTTRAGTVNTRFHEGVDIAPMARDGRGVPLDTVRAIDTGTVVHVSSQAGASNYGKYIVVRHIWGGSPYYSLYAHLNDTWVDTGMVIPQGYPIGRLGYTGDGINKERAHLHFEITMLLNWSYPDWSDKNYGRGQNLHGYYNGLNLVGINVARLYERKKDEPDLAIEDFIREEHQPFYRVTLPRDGRLDLLWRYPWLLEGSAPAEHPSWEISFDASGIPVTIVSSEREVSSPTVTWVEESPFPYSYVSKFRLTASSNPSLSSSGRKYIDLIASEPDSATYAMLVAQGVLGQEDALASTKEQELKEARRRLKAELSERSRKLAAEEQHRQSGGASSVEVPVGSLADAEAEEGDGEMGGGEYDAETGASTSEGMREEYGIDEEKEEEEGIATDNKEATDVQSPHARGFSFNWILNGKKWKIELRPIVLRLLGADNISEYGVEYARAVCPACDDFGLAQPKLRKIDEVTWGMLMEVVDKGKLARNLRDLNGRSITIPLQIRADGEVYSSRIELRIVAGRSR